MVPMLAEWPVKEDLDGLLRWLQVHAADVHAVLFEAVVVSLPCLVVIAMVYRQSKVVAAFAQLSDVAERDCLRKELTKGALAVDKQWFVLGVSNVALTAYLLGGCPTYYYLFFTPKVLSLIALRLVRFYRRKQHFLLWDFCYWANFLCIFYCWFMPTSPAVFRTVFMCANGPLAWSVLAFNHAMIFHSYAHITSVVVHVSPLCLAYGLRWYGAPAGTGAGAARFLVCETAESCGEVTFVELVWGALKNFYLWWLILYYVWIFVALGSYIEQRGYQTLWDRILVMKPIGPVLQRLLKRFPKLLVQLVYLLIHLIFSVLTMSIAVILWHSQKAHFLFLVAICLSTIKNAAEFYFSVFERHYSEVMGGVEAKSSVTTKLVSSSTMGELARPIAR